MSGIERRRGRLLAAVLAAALAIQTPPAGVLASENAAEADAVQAGASDAAGTENAAEAGKYPTAWDLTKIYPTEEDWQSDYDRAMELIPALEQYRGTLGTAEGLSAYLDEMTEGELAKLAANLDIYASTRYMLDVTDASAGQMMAQLSVLNQRMMETVSFQEEELMNLPMETRQEILADPAMADYAYAFDYLIDPDYTFYGEEAADVYIKLTSAMGETSGIYDIFSNAELPYPKIEMPDGSVLDLTEELYNQIVNSGEYDRAFKIRANEQYLTRQIPFINTFAALMEGFMRAQWAVAQADKKASVREAAMKDIDVEPEVYDLLIEAAHKAVPEYQRYLDMHREALGLDEQYPFEVDQSVSSIQDFQVSYDDAIDEVREALSVLGDDYIACFDELVNSPNLDVYPSDTKAGGSSSTMGGVGLLPYLRFNYLGYSSEITTFAHEIGHAVYSILSDRNQKIVNRNAPVFTQEVASILNEILYDSYKMEHAASDDEKMYYLEALLDLFRVSFFTQMQYAEFEDYCYQTIEQGGTLDAETISEYNASLMEFYRGDTVVILDGAGYQWAGIPHYYETYYVYQYASSISYAALIAQKILNGEPGAVESYLEFLKLGGSARPSGLLKTAGADPLDPQTYDQAMAYYSSLVDQYEEMIRDRK